MRSWLVSALGLGVVFAGASCGGESILGDGTGGFGGDLIGQGGSAGIGAAGSGGFLSVGGSGGSGGATGGYAGLPCDVQVALSKSCARIGCHSALDRYGDLDLSDPATIAGQMLGRTAMHGDINCAAPGMPFRECTPSELPATCPPDVLLIDGTNFDESWVVKKLNGDASCGDPMPLPPGDSVFNGWNEARKSCLIEFFRQIAGAGGSAGTGGAAGTAGAGGNGSSVAGSGGGFPAAGSGGASFGDYTPLCDLQQAFKKSCARTGCHSALDHMGGLDLSNVAGIAAQVVNQPALHLDVTCGVPGMPFRLCTEEELAPKCMGSAAVSTLFVDTQDPENSWMLKKLRGEQSTCGDAMPLPPGDSVSNGWSEERRLCIEDFIYYLAGQR